MAPFAHCPILEIQPAHKGYEDQLVAGPESSIFAGLAPNVLSFGPTLVRPPFSSSRSELSLIWRSMGGCVAVEDGWEGTDDLFQAIEGQGFML
jgi:hypothetical protein